VLGLPPLVDELRDVPPVPRVGRRPGRLLRTGSAPPAAPGRRGPGLLGRRRHPGPTRPGDARPARPADGRGARERAVDRRRQARGTFVAGVPGRTDRWESASVGRSRRLTCGPPATVSGAVRGYSRRRIAAQNRRFPQRHPGRGCATFPWSEQDSRDGALRPPTACSPGPRAGAASLIVGPEAVLARNDVRSGPGRVASGTGRGILFSVARTSPNSSDLGSATG
jgi:hypothetical protein